MDYKRIEDLLDKYWACETSIVEEKELKEFFNSVEVPDNLKETASLFKYFEMESSQNKLGTDFEEIVLEQIEEAPVKKEAKVLQLFNRYYKVAAVIVMVIGLSYFVTRTIKRQEKEQLQVADTFQNPEDAFEETKKALLLISNKIGKGKSQVVKLSEFSKTEEKIKNKDVEL